MKPGFRLFLSLLALLACSAPADAQLFAKDKPPLVVASLLADTAAIAPGKPFTVGLRLQITPGWHTYWQFGGDSGAPTQIEWELPPGFKAGPIQWPIPTAHASEGDQLTYVYENEVVLLVEITPPATLPPGDLTLQAKARWLVCEKMCVPGQGDVSLALPSGFGEPANTELFTKWKSQLPKSEGRPFQVAWERRADAVKLTVRDLQKEFALEFFPLPPNADTKPEHPVVSAAAEDGTRTITVPISEGGAPDLAWQGVLVTAKGDAPREGWLVSSNEGNTSAAPQQATKTAATPNLLLALATAFLGGLILNLMPCVLPVIALKIFGFVSQAHEEPRRIFRLGLAFVAGVFAFFFALALLIIAVQAGGGRFNWGFQFQNGYVLTTLIALVFVFAMSMFGVFEITLGSGAATKLDALSHREGYGGAFLHGLFTTLLGTSCTAPFLGPTLGFALAQSAPVIILVFLAIAAGMSLPYFLLTWQPAWMKYLPKPGAWMECVKQFMGFALLSVVIWLLGVFGTSRGVDALINLASFLLLVGVAAWLFGAIRKRLIAWPVVAALVVAGWFLFVRNDAAALPANAKSSVQPAQTGGIAWEPFTPERLIQAVQSGRPVFLDFTADWCLNCKYNERFVLETASIRAAFRDKKIVALRADWTNADPVITDMLKKFGRAGVPVYVIYKPGATEPIVLPEILTQTLLLRHFAEIAG